MSFPNHLCELDSASRRQDSTLAWQLFVAAGLPDTNKHCRAMQRIARFDQNSFG
jgi:hypothetical protein